MKKVIQKIFLGIWVLAAFFPGAAWSEMVDKVVAVVNDDPITLYQLDKMMTENIETIKNIASYQQKKKEFKNLRSIALNRLIGERLLEQEMEKRNIVVTQENVDRAVQNVLERNKMSLPELKKELSAKGQNWSQYQKEMKVQLKRIKFMGQVIAPRVRVTDADLDDFFAEHPDQFGRFQSVEMAQIIFSLAPDAGDAQIQEANRQAQEVLKKARGGDDFADLGKKYSVNSQTAVKDIYQFQQLAPQIASIVSDLKPGEVSEPVRSNMGLHIIKLYERKTMAGEEYQVIREQIREKVFEQKIDEAMGEYIDDLKDKSFIEIKT